MELWFRGANQSVTWHERKITGAGRRCVSELPRWTKTRSARSHCVCIYTYVAWRESQQNTDDEKWIPLHELGGGECVLFANNNEGDPRHRFLHRRWRALVAEAIVNRSAALCRANVNSRRSCARIYRVSRIIGAPFCSRSNNIRAKTTLLRLHQFARHYRRDVIDYTAWGLIQCDDSFNAIKPAFLR